VSELFNANARVNLTHIPYKGMSDASVALQAGQIEPDHRCFADGAGAIRAARRGVPR